MGRARPEPDSRKRSPSRIASPMSEPIEREPDGSGSTTSRQASGGIGRRWTRKRTSTPAGGAASSAAASRWRTRSPGTSATRSGQDDGRARRATAVATAGSSARSTTRASATRWSARWLRANSSSTWWWPSTCQRRSPSRHTTRSSDDGQPTRQRSKPRRCRGWRPRITAVAAAASISPLRAGVSSTRTSSPAAIRSYERCRRRPISRGARAMAAPATRRPPPMTASHMKRSWIGPSRLSVMA